MSVLKVCSTHYIPMPKWIWVRVQNILKKQNILVKSSRVWLNTWGACVLEDVDVSHQAYKLHLDTICLKLSLSSLISNTPCCLDTIAMHSISLQRGSQCISEAGGLLLKFQSGIVNICYGAFKSANIEGYIRGKTDLEAVADCVQVASSSNVSVDTVLQLADSFDTEIDTPENNSKQSFVKISMDISPEGNSYMAIVGEVPVSKLNTTIKIQKGLDLSKSRNLNVFPLNFSIQNLVLENTLHMDSVFGQCHGQIQGRYYFDIALRGLKFQDTYGRIGLLKGSIEGMDPYTFLGALYCKTPASIISIVKETSDLQAPITIEGLIDFEESLAYCNYFNLESELIPVIEMARPMRAWAQVYVSPNMALEKITFDIHTDSVLCKSIHIITADIYGSYKPDHLNVATAVLNTQAGTVYCSYEQCFSTQAYRFLVRGNADPTALSPWLPTWWAIIWGDFVFEHAPPSLNLDISGAWNDVSTFFLYGTTCMKDTLYMGLYADQMEARLWAQENYFECTKLYLRRPEGAAQLCLKWVFDHYHSTPIAIYCSGTSEIDFQELLKPIQSFVPEYLNQIYCTAPPKISLDGFICPQGTSYSIHSRLKVSIDAPEVIYIGNASIQAFRTDMLILHHMIELNNIQTQIASGQGSGTIRICPIADQLNFHCSFGFEHIDVDVLIHELQKLNSKEAVVLKPMGGLLDINFEGSGIWGAIDTYVFDGSFNIREAQLKKFHVLGPLSALLDKPPFNLGSFKLSQIRSDVHMQHAKACFRKLNISGPTLRLVGHGLWDLEAEDLDFNLKIYLLGAIKTPILSQVFTVFRPIGKVFRVRLKGTPQIPQWRLGVDPFFGLFEKAPK